MNRRNQGQSGRQGMQSQTRGNRPAQFNQSFSPDSQSQYGQSYDQDQDYGMQADGPRSRNFSGNSSWSANDSAMDSSRPSSQSSQSYRDTDYDLDGSTYGGQGRSSRSMDRNFGGKLGASEYGSSYGSTQGDYESSRSPSRYSSIDEDRYSSDRGSRFGASDRNMDRQSSSSERFGYPSNMNAWSGSNRSYNAGKSAGRMGQGQQSSYGSQDYETAHPYGQAGSSSFGSFGESSLGQDWGTQHSSQSQSNKSFHGKGPKGYKRSDDRIKEDVCETLSRDHRIDASDIEVNVEEAMVTLSGTVDSREAKRAAEMIIENLSGVEDVKNDIKVKKSSDVGSDMHASSTASKSSTMGSAAAGSPSSKTNSTSTKGTSHI